MGITLPKPKKKRWLSAVHFSRPFLKKEPALAVGLDIGSHSVKICELVRSPKGYKLLSVGSALTPPGALEDGGVADPDAVAQVVKGLVSNLKIKGKKVAISVSGYSVIVKKVNVEAMSAEDLGKHIHEEAEQYIPFDIDDVYLDFQDLKTDTEEETRTDVMLVAAQKKLVDGYVDMLRAVGLKPVVVDVDAFALENCFEANFGLDQNVALVDIGASKMNINIIANGIFTLARDVVLGSQQLTDQIQDRFGLGFEEAEALKLGLAPAGDKEGAMERIFADTCTRWITEVRRALDFYASTHSEAPIDKLVLSGGGAKVAGLADLFRKETDIPTEVLNPFGGMDVDPGSIDSEYLRHIAPEMTLAAGLATRPVEF